MKNFWNDNEIDGRSGTSAARTGSDPMTSAPLVPAGCSGLAA